jgi:MFS family permease
LLIGAGAGFTWVGTLKLTAQWLPPKRFAMISGMTLMLGMIGAAAGQAPLSAVVEAFGWRDTLSAAAFIAFALAALIWLIVRDRVDDTLGPCTGKQTVSLLDGLKGTLKNSQIWYAAVFGSAMTAPVSVFVDLWGVPYMMQAYGLRRTEAAASTSLMLIGWGIGAPLTGWVSDHIGLRKLPMIVSAVIVLVLFSILIYMPGLSLDWARVLLFLHGFFNGGMIICFVISRENNKPGQDGMTLGFVNMMVMASGALFQPFIGWLLDMNWDGTMIAGSQVYSLYAYRVALFSLVVGGVLAIVMAFMMGENRCRNILSSTEKN